MAIKLVDKAKERIKEEFSHKKGEYLPTLKALESKYQISVPTLNAACQQLRDEGVLDGGPGRRYRIPGGLQENELAKESKIQRITREIRESIEKGTYPASLPLPGLKILAQLHNTSISTIAKCLTQLISEKLIVSFDRKYYVGSVPGESKQTSTRPAILTIGLKSTAWQGFNNERFSGFLQNFVNETIRFQLTIVRLICPLERYVTLAHEQFSDEMKRAGVEKNQRFIGCLILGDLSNSDSFNNLITVIKKITNRIVYVGRREANIKEYICPAPVIECFASERESVKIALEQLQKAGHRRFAYLSEEPDDWTKIRRIKLEEEAFKLNMECVTTLDARKRMNEKQSNELLSELKEIRLNGDSWTRKGAEYLLSADLRKVKTENRNRVLLEGLNQLICFGQQTPSKSNRFLEELKKKYPKHRVDWDKTLSLMKSFEILFPFLWEKGITAFVYPRDRSASYVVKKLQNLGVILPKELSSISFDNDLNQAVFSINTVDPGIADLGYRVFHYLINDIPVGLKRSNRKLKAIPKIVNFGSVLPVDS